MKKYNPHSNRTRSRFVPAPKSQKPLIVAAGTIHAGTVFIYLIGFYTNNLNNQSTIELVLLRRSGTYDFRLQSI